MDNSVGTLRHERPLTDRNNNYKVPKFGDYETKEKININIFDIRRWMYS